MTHRNLHVVHLLIRSLQNDCVRFLVHPHEKWTDAAGQSYWTLPAKKTVVDPLAPFLQGTSLEKYVDDVFQDDLELARGSRHLADDHPFALGQAVDECALARVAPAHER